MSYGFHVTRRASVEAILEEGLLARNPQHPDSLHHGCSQLQYQPKGVYLTNTAKAAMVWVRDYLYDERVDGIALIVVDLAGMRLYRDPHGPQCRVFKGSLATEHIVGHLIINADDYCEIDGQQELASRVEVFTQSYPNARKWR
jgi:hypothetical protein